MSYIVCAISCVITFILGIVYRKKVGERKIKSAEILAEEILMKAQDKLRDAENNFNVTKNNAEARKKEILLDAKEEALKIKNIADDDAKKLQNELQAREKRFSAKEELLDKKLIAFESKEQSLNDKSKQLEYKNAKLDELIRERMFELQQISGLTIDQAKDMLLDSIRMECRSDASKVVKEVETQTKLEINKRVIDILTGAMQRCNIDHVTESAVSVVPLPNDEMKGRIIGREGRNIRLLESLTGIDLIIDDTPEAIILSGFNPLRREVARLTLEKLVLDGRIHPARIEELVAKSQKEVETLMREEGEAAVFSIGLQNMHIELIKLLGKLKYRTSYGQNVLQHSIEVAQLCGTIAVELGVDVRLAKRAGLLHDIGKAIDHETDGSHISIGVSLCKKYNESEIVINAVESHHGDVEPTNIISVIVQLADSISAARPGARRETLELHIKRLESLEKISSEFAGVEKSFAIQAGRELRIIVVPDLIKDNELPLLARQIAKKVEDELEYPGNIKINIIRETRAVVYAN